MSEHGHIKFWQEIGRRNVLRVAAVYVGFSWAVVHSGVVVGEALELPHWIMRFVSAVLIVGFPVVVAFAWVYEMTPEGLKRSDAVEKDASITHRTAHRLNIVIIALIVLLAGLYGADRFLLRHEGSEGGEHVAAEGAAKAPATEGVSIAVLPFLNLSSDKEQEFFSDGMTEEITSALAKVKGLKVVARTSAFEFKGENKNVQDIGRALHASHLLEGSVRKAGNRLRITGQLIRTDDGTHVWTEDYDRELTDIFATQDDIARAIVAALRVPLGLKEGETLVSDRSISPEAYQDYLRAKALVRARQGMDEPIGLLDQVVARAPGYAPAWALLGLAHSIAPIHTPTIGSMTPEEFRDFARAMLSKAETENRHALELDPRSADAAVGLGSTLLLRGKFLEAEDFYKHALALDPLNPEGLHFYQQLLAEVGRIKEAVKVGEQLHALEPTGSYDAASALIFWVDGQAEAAIPMLQATPQRGQSGLAEIYASLGRYKEAADAIINSPPGTYLTNETAAAARLLRKAPAAPAQGQTPFLLDLSFVYLYVGLPDRALDYMSRAVEVEYVGGVVFYEAAHPSFSPARKLPRYKELVRKFGLVDYWRARGWPAFCHPVGKDDFACE